MILSLALFPPGLWLSTAVYVARASSVGISQPLDNSFAMELVSPRLRARVAALRTVAWNGGLDISAARLSADDATKIASFAANKNCRITFRDTAHWSADDAVRIASFGKGTVVFGD